MLSRQRAQEIINKLAQYSKNKVIVNILDNGQKLTRFANSEIHQNVEIDDTIISLTVHAGKKSATCQTNTFDDKSLKKLAADADAILEHVPEGDMEIPAVPADPVPETPNDERLAETYDIEGRADAVNRCVGSLSDDYSTAGVISLDTYMRSFGNSEGLFRFYNFNGVLFEVVVTHKDGATGFGAVQTNNFDTCDIFTAFRTAYNKAKTAVDPVFADLGAYTVVLEPAAVRNLINYVMMGLNGAAYQRGTSYAVGRLNEKVFGENITIKDDVNNPATFQRFFDGEGYRRQPLTLVENGVLKNVVHCSKTAKKAGVEPTGHAFSSGGNGGMPGNIVMQGGDSSLPEMLLSVKKGILVTHFHYCNVVNPKTLQVTGLTRDGTYLIENGEITKPLKNMRFTESLLNAFSNVKAISRDLSVVPGFGGPALIPALLIDDFHFTSGQK